MYVYIHIYIYVSHIRSTFNEFYTSNMYEQKGHFKKSQNLYKSTIVPGGTYENVANRY